MTNNYKYIIQQFGILMYFGKVNRDFGTTAHSAENRVRRGWRTSFLRKTF